MAVIQTGTNAYTFYFDKNVVNFNEESIDYPILFDTTDNTKFYYIDENDDFIEYTPQMGFSRVITFHNNLDTTYEYSNTFIIASSGPSLLVYIDNNNKVWTVSQGSIIATNIKGFRLENVNLAENQTLESINSIVNSYIGTKTSLEPSTNLTNTKWYLSDNLSGVSYNEESFNVNFISNGEAFTTLSKQSYRGYIPLYYGNISVFNSNGWVNSNYRTIEITGGADVDSAALLTFLNSAGKQVKEISGFQETKTELKIYEDLTQDEYDGLTKEPNTFYLVKDVGVYKGETLISALQPIISLTPPSSVKSGSLGLEELNIILHTENPIINLNNEYFVKADIYDSENEFVFSHVGNREGALYNKTFTLNTASGDWTLKEVLVQEIINITSWFNEGSYLEGVVPEEYRNEELLRNSNLIEKSDWFVYHYSGGSFNFEGEIYYEYLMTSYVNDNDQEVQAGTRRLTITSDWTFFIDESFNILYGVKSAQILEDQGKLEIATYDAFNRIMDINETPNQFLQRRLDKPSFVKLDMRDIVPISKVYIGQWCKIEFSNGITLYGIITKFSKMANYNYVYTLEINTFGRYESFSNAAECMARNLYLSDVSTDMECTIYYLDIDNVSSGEETLNGGNGDIVSFSLY